MVSGADKTLLNEVKKRRQILVQFPHQLRDGAVRENIYAAWQLNQIKIEISALQFRLVNIKM